METGTLNAIKILKLAAFGLGILAFGHGAAGGLIDWNVTPGGTTFATNTYANWMPYGGVNPNNANAQSNGDVNGISYAIWDGYGPHGSATAGSHHNAADFGGQQFDAKAMYSRNDSTNLYVGIVTGFNPADVTLGSPGHTTTYTAGDLAINPDWSESTSGFGVIATQAAAGTSGVTTLVSGGTWNVPDAAEGFPGQDVRYSSGGTLIASDIKFSYEDLGIQYQDTTSNSMKDVYLLEYTIPLADLTMGPGDTVDLSWGPSCSNDVITECHTITAVPEPASGAILMGSLGMLLMRRKQKKA